MGMRPIEGPRLGDEAVERVNIGHFAVGHMQERRNRAPQIEQRVELDRGFRGPERGPRKHGQTQIDGRSVQGKHRVVEIQSQVLAGVHRPCNANQLLGDIGVDTPVALLVCVGQRVARHRVPNAQVIELAPLGPHADLDVAQALPVSQLCERHAQKLAVAGEGLDVAVAAVSPNSLTEGVHRQGVRLFCVGGPEGSRRGCERHGKSYLTRRRRGEEGDGGGSLTGGAIPSA